MRWLRFFVLAGVAGPAGAQTPAASMAPTERVLGLEDYYRIETVSDVAIAPTGEAVVFVRNRIVEEENRVQREIWFASADGTVPAYRLTSPGFPASSPTWSPDGALLAFSSSRPGDTDGASVWFLRMDRPAGEAFQLDGVTDDPIFDPTNRLIAFTRAVTPEQRDEIPFSTETERKIHERFDGRAYDWMNYRFDRRGYLADPRDPVATPPRELFVVPRTGGAVRQLTTLGFDVRGPSWSPDGRMLVFTADAHQRDEYTYERADLWTVAVDGETRRLTDDEFHYASPVWSPDGRRIVVTGGEGLDVIIRERRSRGAPRDLFVFPAAGGPRTNLTAEWDLIPGSPQWSADGRFVYFSAGVGGNTHLFRVPAAGGPVEQVTHGVRRLSAFSFTGDFSRMAFAATTPTDPGTVYVAGTRAQDERAIVRVNEEWLSGVALQPPERIRYPSADGTSIEGWVMPPVDYEPAGGPYPLILMIHGGPHGAYGNNFAFDRQLVAAQGYFVLFVNPRASTGYGEDFRWATWGGWGILDYQDLMAGVDYVIDRYSIDTTRMGVTGYSYGGFMANWIITQTDRFAAAVSGASISNWVSDYGVADIPRTKESEFFGPPWEKESRELMMQLSPITHAGAVSTPTLFVHGESDHRVPIEEAEQMYVALKKQRVPAKFIRYPDSYHGGWTPWRALHRLYAQLDWWRQYLGDAPSS